MGGKADTMNNCTPTNQIPQTKWANSRKTQILKLTQEEIENMDRFITRHQLNFDLI